MKLLKTLQTLVDKTKELEETVATQTSTIERLTTKLDLDNKDNTDIKQEYQELRDKFFRTLFSQVVVRNAVVDNKISLRTSDIFAGNHISVILTDCYTSKQYGYVINLTNSTEVLDKIIKEVTSIVDLANDNNTITDTTDNNSYQPIVDRMVKDITTKLSTINPDLRPATNLSEFLLHYGYIHGYTRSNYYNEITYEFDYKGKRYTLHPYDTLTQVKHIIADIVNKDLEHLLDNYTEWTIAIANNNNKQ